MFWKLTLAIALVVGLGGAIYFGGVSARNSRMH